MPSSAAATCTLRRSVCSCQITTCHFCGSTEVKVNAAHYDAETGAYLPHRIGACRECYAAGRVQDAPKAPRRPRQAKAQATRVPATDWNYLMAFSAKAAR